MIVDSIRAEIRIRTRAHTKRGVASGLQHTRLTQEFAIPPKRRVPCARRSRVATLFVDSHVQSSFGDP